VVELSTHIGVSYGEMRLVFLGGHNGQWSYLVNGTCLSELHECLEHASSQMVVITEECYKKLQEVQSHTHSSSDKHPSTLDYRKSGTFIPFNSYDEMDLNYPTFQFSEVADNANEQHHDDHNKQTYYKLEQVTIPDNSFEANIQNVIGRKTITLAANNLNNSTNVTKTESNTSTAHFFSNDPNPLTQSTTTSNYLAFTYDSIPLVAEMSDKSKDSESKSETEKGGQQDDFIPVRGIIRGRTLNVTTDLTPRSSMGFPPPIPSARKQSIDGNLLKYVSSNLSDMKNRRLSSRSLSVRNISVESVYPGGLLSNRGSMKRSGTIDYGENVNTSNPVSNYPFSSLGESYEESAKNTVGLNPDANASKYRHFIESLSLFVPLPVISSLSAESNHQIGELRTVTTMFLCLNSFDPIKNADPITLQPFFLIAQQALEDSGGFLRQFLIDDKGCVLIGMWGVPSYTYANNCSRALYCAISILKRISEVSHSCSIGITTGTVFCGTIGALERCDYVGIGSDVNLAARFMAKAREQIFVDEKTYSNLSERNRNLLVPHLEELTFKGIPIPIRPYVYSSQTNEFPSLTDVDSKLQTNSKLLKRKVMHLLNNALDKIANVSPPLTISPPMLRAGMGVPRQVTISNINSATADIKRFHFKSRRFISEYRLYNNVQFLILCGQPGVGKGTAAQYFRIGARERGLQTIHLVAQSKHRNIPYAILRELFLELVGNDNFKSSIQQVSLLKGLILEAYPEDDYTDFDRFHVRIVIEVILGINNLQYEQQFQESFVQQQQPQPGSRTVSNASATPFPSRMHSRAIGGVVDGAGGGGGGGGGFYPSPFPSRMNSRAIALSVGSIDEAPQRDFLHTLTYPSPGKLPSENNYQANTNTNSVPVKTDLNNEIDEEFRVSALKEYLVSPVHQRRFSISRPEDFPPPPVFPAFSNSSRSINPYNNISAKLLAENDEEGLDTHPSGINSGRSPALPNNDFHNQDSYLSAYTNFNPHHHQHPVGLFDSRRNSENSPLRTQKHTPVPAQQNSILANENEHQIFFNIISACLKNAPLALIIENAHFCDELTWNALQLLLNGKNLDVSVLVTVKSNPVQRLRKQNTGTFSSYTNLLNLGGSFAASQKSPKLGGKLISGKSNGKSGGDEQQKTVRITSPKADANDKKNSPQEKNSKHSNQSHFSIGSLASSSGPPPDANKLIFEHGLDYITCDSFKQILEHASCTVYEMKNLSEEEVRLLLLQKLKISSIADELVRTVFKVSSGNTYWCNMICQFIEEQGVQYLEEKSDTEGIETEESCSSKRHSRKEGGESDEEDHEEATEITNMQQIDVMLAKSSRTSSKSKSKSGRRMRRRSHNASTTAGNLKVTLANISSLKTLILCRLELLTMDSQLILKYASIVGSEFTPYLLQSILPIKFQDFIQHSFSNAEITSHHDAPPTAAPTAGRRSLAEALEQLEKHGFLYCISEHPTFIYSIENELIQNTLYELIPPRYRFFFFSVFSYSKSYFLPIFCNSDASAVHLEIAKYLEKEYLENLRPFYPA
jgi:hypothetical protein